MIEADNTAAHESSNDEVDRKQKCVYTIRIRRSCDTMK